MKQRLVKTPAGELGYRVVHRERVRKRMHMELDDSGGLLVVAPPNWSERHINKLLKQNIHRVERFLLKARQQWVEPLQYSQGESHLFLGEPYPLELLVQPGYTNKVTFDGHRIRVRMREQGNSRVHGLLHNWYRRQAQSVFPERLALVSARAEWMAGREPDLRVRRMKRTWGNCSSSGVIKLNTHLIKAPLRVIDSVIAHELCHLREMNHGKNFYALLRTLNPGWKQDRQTLLSESNRYLR